MFRVRFFATPQNAPFLPFSGSSLMTGACHHLWPVLVLREDPSKAQKGCSFDCRCKDTTFSGRMQAFTLTFYATKSISSCNTISSIDFLSELYCRNNEKARKDSEVAEEMKRGHLVSMSFRVIWKSKCHFRCYSIYKYLFIYIYSDFLTLGKHNDPKWLWPNDPLSVMLLLFVC